MEKHTVFFSLQINVFKWKLFLPMNLGTSVQFSKILPNYIIWLYTAQCSLHFDNYISSNQKVYNVILIVYILKKSFNQ